MRTIRIILNASGLAPPVDVSGGSRLLQILIITMREGIEAFLIVAITAGVLRQTGRAALLPAVCRPEKCRRATWRLALYQLRAYAAASRPATRPKTLPMVIPVPAA